MGYLYIICLRNYLEFLIVLQEINKALDQAILESDVASKWLDKDYRAQQSAASKQ